METERGRREGAPGQDPECDGKHKTQLNWINLNPLTLGIEWSSIDHFK